MWKNGKEISKLDTINLLIVDEENAVIFGGTFKILNTEHHMYFIKEKGRSDKNKLLYKQMTEIQC